MLFDSYTISFCPGSSGRLIHTILHNMIMGNDIVFNFTENNDSHDMNINLNVEIEDIHATNIYQIIKFNDNPAKILITHRFPDIDTIRERFKYKMGVVVINIKPTDVHEVLYNSFLKNRNIKLNGEVLRGSFIENKLNEWNNFINVSHLKNQDDILILEYSTMFDVVDGKYTTLEKLEEFTGLTVPEGIVKTFENYAMGRQKLIDSNMPWLCELKRNLDK